MSPPRKLRVNYTTLRVKEDPDIHVTDAADYQAAQQLIRVRPGLTGAYAVNTLLHELLHVGYDLGHLTKSGDEEADEREEQTVTVLANHLTDLLGRNPTLLQWIERELK